MRPRSIIAAFGLALTLLLPAVSSAATLQFTNPNCSDFQITSSANGVVTLNCVLITAPVCTITPSTPNPVINTILTLSASCTGNTTGYSYAWGGGNTANCSGGQTCADLQTVAGPITYALIATAPNGSRGPTANLVVTWVAAASQPPSGCTLAANPTSLPTGGGAVTLTASCSGGGAPTGYSWSGGTLQALTTTATQTTNITATTTFSVTPTNGAGNGNTATTTVTVAGGGGGGGGGGSFCDKYQNVILLDVPWGGVADTRSAGSNFLPNGILVAKFTVPAGWANNPGSVGKTQVAEFGDPPTYRQASLSTMACDFRGVATGQYDQYFRDITGKTPFPLQWAFGNTAVAEFSVTGNALFRPQLQPGTTYYYNVRNWNPYGNNGLGSTSCGGASCNAIVSINTP